MSMPKLCGTLLCHDFTAKTWQLYYVKDRSTLHPTNLAASTLSPPTATTYFSTKDLFVLDIKLKIRNKD